MKYKIDYSSTDISIIALTKKFKALYQYVLKEMRMHLNFATDKKTDDENLLRDNIVIFEIYYKTFTEHVLAEEPKMNLIGLISDLCATWNLYVNFSILSIFTLTGTFCFVIADFLKVSTEFFHWFNRKTRAFYELDYKRRNETEDDED